MKTQLTEDQGLQVGTPLSQYKQKAGVYESIPNDKRCELIRKVQTEGKKLKESADELGIIYSTAKTIWQTFKKERRIAKKPKRSIGTKKALKHEEHLYAVLNKGKIPGILSKILSAEFTPKEGRKRISKKSLPAHEESKALQSVSTRAITASPVEKPVENSLLRVQSANEIVLLPQEEDGPKPGQKSRSVTTSDGVLGLLPKKDKFYIYNDSDLDDKYKGVVDCSNPVSLRNLKRKPSMLPSFSVAFNETIREENKAETSVDMLAKEEIPEFNFKEYTPQILSWPKNMIYNRPLQRFEVTLPIPDALFRRQQKQA